MAFCAHFGGDFPLCCGVLVFFKSFQGSKGRNAICHAGTVFPRRQNRNRNRRNRFSGTETSTPLFCAEHRKTPFPRLSVFTCPIFTCRVRGPPQFLKNISENAGANEEFSCGFPSILGITPGVDLKILVFVLLKSWDAIPRMEFRIPRMGFRIARAAPRIPRNSLRALRMAFSLRERFS